MGTMGENAYSESDLGSEVLVPTKEAELKERIALLEATLTEERSMRKNLSALVFKLKRQLDDANKAKALLEQKTAMKDLTLAKRQELKRKKRVPEKRRQKASKQSRRGSLRN